MSVDNEWPDDDLICCSPGLATGWSIMQSTDKKRVDWIQRGGEWRRIRLVNPNLLAVMPYGVLLNEPDERRHWMHKRWN